MKQHIQTLSTSQARKIVLLSQGIHQKNDPLHVIEQLGYIQIDTISVIQRAHHHTLWNRVKNFQLDQLDELQQQREIFEYWSHAAAYLPMRRHYQDTHSNKNKSKESKPSNDTKTSVISFNHGLSPYEL